MTLKRRHKNSKRAHKARANDAHRQFIRGFVCVVNNQDCWGPTECAHVRSGTDGGAGLKPGDEWTIPLCSFHHKWQTDNGEKRFENWTGISMKAEAEKYAARSPHLRKLEREDV